MIKFVKAFIFVVIFSLSSFVSYAQVKCINKQLTELVGQMPDVGLNEGFAGEVVVPTISKVKPIVIQRNNDGVICHMGIKFFNRDVIAKHPSPIYHFIERYFLELMLLPNHENIATKMKLEHVTVTSEEFSLKSLRQGLQDVISTVSNNLSVYITCNNNRYAVSCLNNNKLLVKIGFPVRYELITGFTKLEAENSVYPDMLMQGKQSYAPLGSDYMSSYKDGMYCSSEDYYVTEDIISTTYYNKVKEEYIPVFSTDYLKESVYNLFNTGYDWGVEAEIEQDLYGNKKNNFTVSLSQLANFLKSKNCSLYTGVRKYDKTHIEGVMMAVNMELGYQHIMMFSFEKSLIENPKGGTVKIKMYSYVPIHNISSIL